MTDTRRDISYAIDAVGNVVIRGNDVAYVSRRGSGLRIERRTVVDIFDEEYRVRGEARRQPFLHLGSPRIGKPGKVLPERVVKLP